MNKLVLCSILLLSGVFVSAQSGGTFEITRSVISGGGDQSSGGNFSLQGTIAQPIAGYRMFGGGRYTATSGFWNYDALYPTAAMVELSGKIISANGEGIANVGVVLISPDGSAQTTHTGTFGNFSFSGVESGRTYLINAVSRHYIFSQPSIVRYVTDNISDISFVAFSN